MKTNDRFLIGIVIGLVLLVVAALVVARMRPEPTFQAETSPEGVAMNYLLALQQRDLSRAYGYLATDLSGYPTTLEKFAADLNRYGGGLDERENAVGHEVVETSVIGNQATITMGKSVFTEGGLFDEGQYRYTFLMHLRRDGPETPWKLTGSDSNWAWCWNEKEGCE